MNGYSHGRLQIITGGDVPTTTTIDLPITNKGGGLEEITNLRQIRKEGIGMNPEAPVITQIQRAQGFELIWDFHYEDWIFSADLLSKYYPVLKAWMAGYTMKLIPAIDVPERIFTVILTNETLRLKRSKAKQKNKFHKGALFTFQTVSTLNDPVWMPTPQEEPGGGTIDLPMEG